AWISQDRLVTPAHHLRTEFAPSAVTIRVTFSPGRGQVSTSDVGPTRAAAEARCALRERASTAPRLGGEPDQAGFAIEVPLVLLHPVPGATHRHDDEAIAVGRDAVVVAGLSLHLRADRD